MTFRTSKKAPSGKRVPEGANMLIFRDSNVNKGGPLLAP